MDVIKRKLSCIDRPIELNSGAIVLGIIFFIYTLSSSEYLLRLGVASLIEYLAEGSLVLYIVLPSIFSNNRKRENLRFLLFLVSVSFGLLFQSLALSILLRLLASLVLIISLMTIGDASVKNDTYPYFAAWGVLFGLIANFILGVVGGVEIVSEVAEKGIFGIGFNCGMDIKNFAAITAFGALVVFGTYLKSHGITVGRVIAMLISLLVVYLSDSRTTQIALLFALGLHGWFFLLPKLKNKMRNEHYSAMLVVLAFIVGALVVAAFFFLLNSSTYAYRYRGLINYLDMYHDDLFHMLFGNGEMAFGNPAITYAEAVRSVTGWDGTVELPILSILIKNGIIGLIAYVVLQLSWLRVLFHVQDPNLKGYLLINYCPLLLCSIAENYIVNVHVVYMPLVYCTVWGLMNSSSTWRNTTELVIGEK